MLRVRGSNDDDVWNEAGAALPVKVLPAPWFSWWAWCVYLALGTVFLTYGWLQMRRRRDLQRKITGEIYRSHVDQLLGADVENAKVERPFADLEIHPDDLALVDDRGDTRPIRPSAT